MSKRIFFMIFTIAILFSMVVSPAFAGDVPVVPVPDASGLGIAEEDVQVAPELQAATGPVQIVVGLVDAPLSVAVGPNAKQHGSALNPSQQLKYLKTLNQKQDYLLSQIAGLGGVELGRVNKALNAVIVEVDASQIEAIAALPNVASIRPVINYDAALMETVPYIGASALQDIGVDGTGVRVAVLDSGIDYTHKNLGGSGSVADFDSNDPTIIEDDTFPTWKVVGGYDFVGEVWPSGPLAPDPDPLDKGSGAGHGTHVADIIAGKSLDGTHVGTAPGASLYAVGVCSKISTSCSGVALLEGMDFALDPNQDGNIDDAVDVINMSLGSNYGQRQDDLSFASSNAVELGVVVVAAAGNGADIPYIVSSPSISPEVISVAQTQVPSSLLYLIQSDGVMVGGSWQTWSAAPALVNGTLAYDATNATTKIGCTNTAGASPWTGTPFSGKILLVDRGTCAISMKVSNGAAAGAIAVVIANNAAQAPGDLPPDFSYGGGNPSVAGYSITRADGIVLKTKVGQLTTIDPESAVSLVGNMVASSSRGPSISYNSAIKPDIGAPGASISAVYGTGDGEAAFGGTSGATPMISGSAALLIQKFPDITPLEVKARLMNTAETEIGLNPVGQPGVMAPITRIGGGEVRVSAAADTTTVAWDADDLTPSLSFGYAALTGSKAFKKTVVVRNYSNTTRTYAITADFRYPDDAASGAVTISAPATIKVKANSSATFDVMLKVDVTKLPIWGLNSGSLGGSGYLLQSVEFDGYVTIADATDSIHVPWHILPHRSAEVTPASSNVTLSGGMGSLVLNQTGGALDGQLDVFSLLGTSGRIPNKYLPGDGDNYAVIDLKNFGARMVNLGGGQYGIQFAINTFGTRADANYPAEFDIYIDNNLDGTDDFVLYNAENGGFGATGQNVVIVYNLSTHSGSAYYYSDVDFNSSDIIMTAPLAPLGLSPSTQFNVSVYACDNYFTGLCTDAIMGMTYTAGMPRYYPDSYSPVVPQNGSTVLNIFALPGGDTASPSQEGLLLLYRNAREQRQADPIFITP